MDEVAGIVVVVVFAVVVVVVAVAHCRCWFAPSCRRRHHSER